jgi:RNA polymerase sigma-70 factor, ECF subfamily
MNAASIDDATLVRLCIAERNDDAFPRELIHRFGRLIMQTISWTFRRFSKSIREDIEDVFQEVFVSLFKNDCEALAHYDPSRASLGTYLCTIAKNAAINACKRKRVDIVEYTDIPGEERETPETLLDLKDAAQRIESILPSLTARERFFFKLYFEDNAPPEEIAEILGVSIDTVYSKKAKIIGKLRDCVPETIKQG